MGKQSYVALRSQRYNFRLASWDWGNAISKNEIERIAQDTINTGFTYKPN